MSFSQRLGTLKRYGIHNDKSGRSMVLYNSSSRSLNSSMTAPTRDHQTSSSLLDAISSSKLCRVARTGARPPQCPHAQEVAFGVERGESVTTSDRFAAYMTKGSRIVTNNNEYRVTDIYYLTYKNNLQIWVNTDNQLLIEKSN